MQRFRQSGSILFISLLLFACGGTKNAKFYLLESLPAAEPPSKSLADNITIRLRPLKLPGYLDRPQIVIRRNQYRLVLDEYHRWGESLADNFSRVFAENLSVRISPAKVERFAAYPRGAVDFQVSIDILRFELQEPQGAVIMNAGWKLLDGRGRPLTPLHQEKIEVPVEGSGHAAIIQSHSLAVSHLADKVSAGLKALIQSSSD
ncbi:MAG: PqiC family protein [Gammaproteobacteria bacterium]